VAVAVIRDGLRPPLPETHDQCPAEFEELITSCWHLDPTVRPTFLEIMTRLSNLNGDSSAGGGLSITSRTSTSTSSGHGGGTDGSDASKRNLFGLWPESKPLPTDSSSEGTSSTSGSQVLAEGAGPATVGGPGAGMRAPEGEVTIVFTDITRAVSLWEFNPAAMRDATLVHNATLRSALRKFRGYEVAFLRDKNSGEGSFCMAFQLPSDALAWCSHVQTELLDAEWPAALLEHPGAAEEWGDTDDRYLLGPICIQAVET
jgi:hypothetical protein